VKSEKLNVKNIIIIEKDIKDVYSVFPQMILSGKQMHLKIFNEGKFEICSNKSFDAISMIEKEHYFITGQLKKVENCIQISYTVRANATFKILSIVVPLMAFPTLFMGMKGGNSSVFVNSMIFVGVLISSTFIFLFQGKRLRLEGENDFKNLIKKLE
jgi:hypothetical protein